MPPESRTRRTIFDADRLGKRFHRLRPGLFVGFALALGAASLQRASAQSTLTPWGNIHGMRTTEGFIEFEAGIRVIQPDWRGFSGAVKYLQRPRYVRIGSRAEVESEITGLGFHETVEDTTPGQAALQIDVVAKTNLSMAGAYFFLDLPDTEFAGGDLELIEAAGSDSHHLALSAAEKGGSREYFRREATGIRVRAPQRSLELRASEAMTVVVQRRRSNRPSALNDPAVRQQFVDDDPETGPAGYQVYFELMRGDAAPGVKARASFTLSTRAAPDPRPARIVLDATRPGRAFQGIGGNVRLQGFETDRPVLDFNLEHLPVSWARFDLLWAEWDPEENHDPLADARAGQIHQKIKDAMDVARTLAERRVPVIVSAWVPPQWARAPGAQNPGLRGTALDTNKLGRICFSLASYLVFLKERAGVEAVYFSFNEPETGVEVRQTPLEHAEYIKRLGTELARQGLTTKLLLGDTAHGTPAALDFIRPSLQDPATLAFIGAVAFHTWRGCTPEALPGWADAARQLGVPLLVTEAGPDAHLHEYPAVRLEPWFQLQEIELYLRICALAQPATIMEWQLTADYSLLEGGGVYGEAGRLRPTQRFWNLNQLGSTPRGAFALPVTSDRPEITCAAFGDPATGRYAVHIVNRGAERPVVVTGFPAAISTLRRFSTDAARGMEQEDLPESGSGHVNLVVPAASYTTLLGTNSPAPRTTGSDSSPQPH